MREVRAALDEVARSGRRGRIPVTAIVMRDAAENLYYGMDLQTWVREGLVDTLIPYTSAVFLDSAADSWVDPRGADWFVELTRGTGCTLSMSLLPRMMPPAVYRERAAGLYRAGVESFFFWDLHARPRQLHRVMERPAAPGPQGRGAGLDGGRHAGSQRRPAAADQPGRVGPVLRHPRVACRNGDVRAFYGSPSLLGSAYSPGTRPPLRSIASCLPCRLWSCWNVPGRFATATALPFA